MSNNDLITHLPSQNVPFPVNPELHAHVLDRHEALEWQVPPPHGWGGGGGTITVQINMIIHCVIYYKFIK